MVNCIIYYDFQLIIFPFNWLSSSYDCSLTLAFTLLNFISFHLHFQFVYPLTPRLGFSLSCLFHLINFDFPSLLLLSIPIPDAGPLWTLIPFTLPPFYPLLSCSSIPQTFLPHNSLILLFSLKFLTFSLLALFSPLFCFPLIYWLFHSILLKTLNSFLSLFFHSLPKSLVFLQFLFIHLECFSLIQALEEHLF